MRNRRWETGNLRLAGLSRLGSDCNRSFEATYQIPDQSPPSKLSLTHTKDSAFHNEQNATGQCLETALVSGYFIPCD